jgi:anti-sigma B factor antagonist
MHDLETSRSTIAGVEVERLDELALVKVGRELDLGPADTLDTRIEGLLADGVNQIVIDLRRAQFIDSSGVRILVKYELRSRRDGFELGVIPAAGHVRRVFETMGIDRLLRLQSDLESLDEPEGPPQG